MYIIGVTGGIASGKSTVAGILSERYELPLISFDLISREIVAPGKPLNAEIKEEFGRKSILPDGSINRKFLRELVCTSNEKREKIDSLFNPYMISAFSSKLDKLKAEGAKIVIVENAMIFEFEQAHLYNKIIVVGCSDEEQILRVMNRDGQSREHAVGIINSQFSLEQKAKLADFLILNNGSIQNLTKNVDEVFADISISITKEQELLRKKTY